MINRVIATAYLFQFSLKNQLNFPKIENKVLSPLRRKPKD
jgi:hypothetical protein